MEEGQDLLAINDDLNSNIMQKEGFWTKKKKLSFSEGL